MHAVPDARVRQPWCFEAGAFWGRARLSVATRIGGERVILHREPAALPLAIYDRGRDPVQGERMQHVGPLILCPEVSAADRDRP
jgi:hypothetical protein